MSPILRKIAVYEKILSNAVWSKTPLLTLFAERMESVLKRLKHEQQQSADSRAEALVYVLLYHRYGGDFSIWADSLKTIQFSAVSRPVYQTMLEAKAAIRDDRREGLVALYVSKSSILYNDNKCYLKPESIQVSAIKAFFWGGKTFDFKDLALIETESLID